MTAVMPVAATTVVAAAAAVTTVGVVLTSLPQTTIVRVDHPFIVVIRERLSGTILFMGKITKIPVV